MTSEKILEMLNNNEIEELRRKLKKEIYCKELKKTGCTKSQISAMTSFFKYHPFRRTDYAFPLHPFVANFDEKRYLVCVHPHMIVMLHRCPENSQGFTNKALVQKLNNEITRYNTGITKCGEADLRNILASAKAEGYRRLQNETRHPKFYFHCGPDYYRFALVDIAFNMLDDNQPVCVSRNYNPGILRLETSLGVAYILPCYVPSHDKFVFDMMGNLEDTDKLI